MLKEFSLEGKKAFITGGGRGLGRAIALVFAEAGADVAVIARTLAQCEETTTLVKKLGRRAFPFQCDIADSRQVDDTVAKATKALGQIDILVNNAGQVTVGPLSPLPIQKPKDAIWDWGPDKRMSDETLNRIMGTNLSGTVYCARAVGEQMVKRRSGKVINVCSSSSIIAYPFETAYAPSKAALQMFTKVLALEWAQFNVQINGINPGWFVTDMTRSGFDNPKTMQERINTVPLKRLTDSRDLGLLALYLASPASDWMTGQVLSLDGGESASQF
ncbi:MAG: SDR family NAD(P)-dependent oxidoreductase [SAR202 cluster bacterium]|nr:SDR family NAD(P)-dependent oxidoreductase [SAR202 cluster bacterium]